MTASRRALAPALVLAACAAREPAPPPDVPRAPDDLGARDAASDRLGDEASLDADAPRDHAPPRDALDGDALDIPDVPDALDADDAPALDRAVACDPDATRATARSPHSGYVRFVHLARGVGPVRFYARTMPLYRPGYVEAVVPEGSTSGYVETLGVSYQVRAEAAGDAGVTAWSVESDDAGALPDVPARDAALTPCDAAAGEGDLTDALCADVYPYAGCTVVLAGTRDGDRDAGQHLRLWSITDPQRRTADCDTSLVRVVNALARGPMLDVDVVVDATPPLALARAAAWIEPTGSRVTPTGRWTAAVRGDGAALVTTAVTARPGHGHTLYVWGDGRGPMPSAAAMLLDDIPPALW